MQINVTTGLKATSTDVGIYAREYTDAKEYLSFVLTWHGQRYRTEDSFYEAVHTNYETIKDEARTNTSRT